MSDAAGQPLGGARVRAALVRPVEKRPPVDLDVVPTGARPLRRDDRPPGARQLGRRHRRRTSAAGTSRSPAGCSCGDGRRPLRRRAAGRRRRTPLRALRRSRCAGRPTRRFCCAGCASAHAIIGAAGLGAFYRRLGRGHARTGPCRSTPTSPAMCAQDARGESQLDLLVDGLDCAACVWLIESLLARNPAVLRRARATSRRAGCRCAGTGTAADANGHAGLVAALGYRPAPYDVVAAAGARRCRDARTAALPRRRRFRRRQRDAAVGRGLVGP